MTLLTSRYSRLSGLLLFVTAILLIQAFFAPLKNIKRPDFLRGWKTQSSMRTILADEEERYRYTLEDREDLVRKWGPRPEDVRP